MRILEGIGLSFDDVLLTPRKTVINSRFDGSIDLSTILAPNLQLKFPIISANMDTVTGSQTASRMHELGGLGIVHRFLTMQDHARELAHVTGPKVLCIGTGDHEWDRCRYILDLCATDLVLIDIAHGHADSMIKQIKRVKEWYTGTTIIAGNIATAEGARDLHEAGASTLKVGVGPGSLCSTRIHTGCGVPQLTAIMNVASYVDTCANPPTVIADGGVRNSGDIIKALAAGADAVMVGALVAGTEEAPGELIQSRGGIVKVYRGLASASAQESWKGHVTSVEGEMTHIPYKGPLSGVIGSLINGMLSGMSYQNAKTIRELQENAIFVRQTEAGYRESRPHGLF